MGFCRAEIGRISTESRQESFYVHDHPDDDEDGTKTHIFPMEMGDPEFDYLVLEDLIGALIDLRDNDLRYADWKRTQMGEPSKIWRK